MRTAGLHHVTAITADAAANVDFYVRVLGLRLVKKTINFDAPDVYHLYYGDETGHPGSVLTFFEFPGAQRGGAGAGMVHVIRWRVAGHAALDFWQRRLDAEGVAAQRGAGWLRFHDPEGLGHELLDAQVPDQPLVARAPDIDPQLALHGLHGVRAYAAEPASSAGLLGDLGFVPRDGAWQLTGERRRAEWGYDPPPDRPGHQGAGSVHHVAWAVADDEQLLSGRQIALRHGRRPTDVIDRQYFHSVYFREANGVLFELATLAPGFAIDEPVQTLGEALMLPPRYEALRASLERRLTPLHNPRAAASGRA
jgi:glyoxalase family protein